MLKKPRKNIDVPRRRTQGQEPVRSPLPSTFRRGVTITGSISSGIKSVSEHNAAIKSPRVQAHDLIRHRRRLGMLLLLVIVVGGCIALAVSQFTARVTVSPNVQAANFDAAPYVNAINQYYSQRPIERIGFLLDDERLNRSVQEQLPEVANVHSDSNFGIATTTFTVDMRQPAAGWSLSGDQWYVDEQGVPFKKNYYGSPLVTVVDDSGVPTTGGQAIASERFLAFVGVLVGDMRSYDFSIETITIPRGTTRQVRIGIEGQSYPVLFTIDRPAGEQAEDAKRAVGYLRQQNMTPQYVDIRISGRAYYRL